MIRSRFSSAFATLIGFVLLGICGWQLRIADSVAAQGTPAPVPVWSPTGGPQDAQVFSLFSTSGQLLAATSSGVWTSTDVGRNWQKRNAGLPESVFAFSFAAIENTIFVGTRSGVYRSTNGAQLWQSVSVGLPASEFFITLTADAERLYALTYSNGLFVSTDQGESWTPINQGLPLTGFSVIARGTTLWTATSRGVYRSTDSGQSWARTNQGLPVNATANSFATDGERFYVSLTGSGITQGAAARGVFVWDEAAGRWNSFNDGFGDTAVNALHALGAELYATTNKGVFRLEKTMWLPASNGLRSGATAITSNGNALFVASGGDIFTSLNRGETWTPLNVRFDLASFFTAFAYNNAGAYVATPTGVYLRPNQVSAVWRRASNGLTDSHIVDLTTQGQTLWAASLNGETYFSSNDGDTWTPRVAGLTGQTLTTIAANEERTFVGTKISGVFSLLRRDGRDTWQPANEGLTSRRINDLLVDGATLYAATNEGIFRSTNGGALWTPINKGLTLEVEKEPYEPESLTVDGTTLYAVLRPRATESEIPIISAFPDGPVHLVFRSDDNGAQWIPVMLRTGVMANFGQIVASAQGLLALGPGSTQLGTITFPPTQSSAAVWLSTDKGRTWNPADAGLLTNNRGFSSIFDSLGQLLGATPTQGLLATAGQPGVYARDLVSMTCRYELRLSNVLLTASASTVTIPITASANNCAWRADSQSDWITIVNAPSGNGSGSVQLNIAANNTTASRFGSVTVAGTTVSFIQNGCEIAVVPQEQRVEASGGTATIRITAANTCPWEIKTDVPWLTTTTPTGAGNATVNFTVAANASNLPRTASIFLGGATLFVTQAAAQGSCAAQTLTPNQWTRGELIPSDCRSNFGNGQVSFNNAPVDFYSFTASANQNWMLTTVNGDLPFPLFPLVNPVAILGPNGEDIALIPIPVQLVVQLSTSRQLRFVTPTAGTYKLIFGQDRPEQVRNYLIRLSDADCPINLPTRTSSSLPAAGASGSVALQTEASCVWQAVSTKSWLRLTGKTNGQGDDTVSFTADENLGVARSGFILINNKVYSVVQAAAVNAPLTLTGLNPSYTEIGGTGLLLNVTGNGFTNESKVLWGDKPLPTTFVSPTQLRAALPASELTRAGEVQVTVETPTPSLWRTPSLPFVVRPAQQLWRNTNGPGGGAITALYQQGSRLWAGTTKGRVFASTDGGRSWQPQSSLERSPDKFVAAGNFLYAVAGGTVFRLDLNSPYSDWSRILFAEGNVFLFNVQHLTVKGQTVFALYGGKLYRLEPGASFWKLVNDKLLEGFGLSINALEAAGNEANDPLYLLATQFLLTGGGIEAFLLVSNDEGKNWRRIKLTLPPSSNRLITPNLNRLHIINRRPYFTSTDGIYRFDNREQFVRVGNASDGTGNAPGNAIALAWEGDTLYAAVQESGYYLGFESFTPQVFRLEGDRWVAADTGLDARYIQVMTAGSGGLFVGTSKGIWQTAQRGDSWTERNEGLNATSVFMMATSGNALFAASDAGLHRTVNNGQTWTRADHGLPVDSSLIYPALFPGGTFGLWLNALAANGDTLYAATPSGIYRSTDQGQSWRNTGLVGYATQALAFSGSQVLAGAFKGIYSPLATTQPGGPPTIPYPVSDFGVYRSTNGAGAWRVSESSLFNDSVVALATLNSKVFAALGQSGIRVSEDNGVTWRNSSNGLNSSSVYSLVTVGSVLLVSSHEGVYRSTDQGQTWNLTDAPRTPFTTLVTQGAMAYGLNNGYVYRSVNLGESWVQLPPAYVDRLTGFVGNHLRSLQPLGDRLFVGTNGEGVLMANLAPARATAVNAASYVGGELAPNSIATLFGSNLATGTQLASGAELPEELGGTHVIVRSSTGGEYPAKLFFVSPGQINFLMPQLPVNVVPVQIFTTTTSGQQSIADIPVTELALGLFAANGNGQGVANATALRVKADGSSSYEPVFRFDETQNRFVPLPLDVSAANETLYLVLYGTGIGARAPLDKVTAEIGGQAARVVYAGPQGGFAGVDQLNVALPAALAGKGEVDLRVTVNGKAANTLKLMFK